jgi:hypothetical protein
MKRRVAGKYSQYTFKLIGGLEDDGTIDDVFGNTDLLVDITFHKT